MTPLQIQPAPRNMEREQVFNLGRRGRDGSDHHCRPVIAGRSYHSAFAASLRLMHKLHKMHNALRPFVIVTSCRFMACVNSWPSAFFLKYACIAALALAIAWPGPAKGQPEAEDSPYQPGLIAAYRMGDRQATRIDEG